MKPCTLYTAILAACCSSSTLAADTQLLEKVVIQAAQNQDELIHIQSAATLVAPDAAALLNQIPGANISRNGPLSGVAQYRGSYGDQININIDGASFVSGGPNSMDAPLSYAPGALLKDISVSRGVASVSAGQQTSGGHIEATTHRGDFAFGYDWETHATVDTLFNFNNQGNSSALQTYAANSDHKVGVTLINDHGDDAEFDGNDRIKNSFYDRQRVDLFYGFQNDDSGFNLMRGRNETGDTGTPSLPMDILYIDSDLASADGYTTIGDTRLSAKASYNEVDHGMDNFSHRPVGQMTAMMMGEPVQMDMYRHARATANGHAFSLQLQTPLASGELTLGIDNSSSVHDMVITDPTNTGFQIDNINNAKNDITGIFSQWKRNNNSWLFEAGLRYNRVSSDADEIGATGAPAMLATNSMALITAFNNSDRSRHEDNTDGVLKLAYNLDSNWSLNAGLAYKQRAPSYLERYLWLPLETSGGLADGRTYIGNIDLDSEAAKEVNLGLEWASAGAYFSAQVFYRKVNDYIQGTEVTAGDNAMQINMISNMMAGKDALQFNNVDARLYGTDLAYGLPLNNVWQLDGVLSYVRGKRTDISDNLYRMAPLNHRLSVSYNRDNYSLSVESVLYAEQNKVSQENDEDSASGYGLVNLSGNWQVSNSLVLRGGVENLFDKGYQDHLSGYNHVADSDVAVGEHLYGMGRSLTLGLNYLW